MQRDICLPRQKIDADLEFELLTKSAFNPNPDGGLSGAMNLIFRSLKKDNIQP